MLGPYSANRDGTIAYRGNNIFEPVDDIASTKVPVGEFPARVSRFEKDAMWSHIAKINHLINRSTNRFFDEIGALYTTLPLTTRMISSPGAVYGKEAISYTTDTSPITLEWFDLEDKAFLSESSQIYLEISLMQQNVDAVYSIYNSFRKEEADITHLSEFHHIEYEGKVDQITNERVALKLIRRILQDLLEEYDSLRYFLSEARLEELLALTNSLTNLPRLTFREALDILREETGDEKYREFTLEHFGSWEEVLLTEKLGTMVIITEFPLLEVPFYHAMLDGKDPRVANNADLIWPGYREFLGSGHRVRSEQELEEKSEIFSLPKEDYAPYLQTRTLETYHTSSGFGLGWERLLQGLLEMPTIWSVCQFPRVDGTMRP